MEGNNLLKMIKLKFPKNNIYRQMNRLRETLSQTWLGIQGSLFPWLAEELGPLTQKQQDLAATLEQVRIEELIPSGRGFPCRPADDRAATDISLRRICG